MIRAGLIAVCLLAGSVSGGAQCAELHAAPPARHEYTNVILLSLQCLRADHLGAYGYQRGTSRNIDAFAGKAVVFENAISQANLTPVTQMSALTSQYPRVNGLISFEVTRDMVTQRTLPQILKYYGYTTAASISSPEFFMRFDTESGTMINPGDVFSRSFDYYGRTVRGPQGGGLRVVPTEALNWLKNNREKKFFLWIGSGLLHMPYAAAVPPPFQGMYDPPGYVPFWKRLPAGTGNPEWSADPSYDVFSRVYRDDFYWGFKPVHHLTDDDRKYVAGRYDAGVYYTDLFVGELLKLLDELKLAERTLVILQSMHGDDLGEHGLYFHYDITEPVIKNALIMRFPGMQSVGRRVAEQVQGLDVLPTVLDFLDIPVPADARGKSLVPLARDERGATGTEYVFIDRLPWWEYVLSNWYLEFQSGNAGQFAPEEEAELERYRQQLTASFSRLASPPGDIAVRTNRWKLILRKHPVLLEQVSWWRFITGKGEKLDEVVLYDLVKDPGESRNVAKSYPAVTSALKERLLAWDREIEQQRPVYTREKRQIIPYP